MPPNPRRITSAPVDTRPAPPAAAPELAVSAPPVVAAVPPVLLTAAEVADLLRVDVYTVRAYARSGELPAFRVGRTLRFDAAVVGGWLADRRLIR